MKKKYEIVQYWTQRPTSVIISDSVLDRFRPQISTIFLKFKKPLTFNLYRVLRFYIGRQERDKCYAVELSNLAYPNTVKPVSAFLYHGEAVMLYESKIGIPISYYAGLQLSEKALTKYLLKYLKVSQANKHFYLRELRDDAAPPMYNRQDDRMKENDGSFDVFQLIKKK